MAESVVNGLAGLALTFILAWLLEPTEVGEAAIALAVVGVIEVIAGLGMTEAVVAARSGDTRVIDTAFATVVSLALVGSGLCWLLAGPIGHFYRQPIVTELLEVAAFILPVNALAAIPTALLMRKMRAATLTIRMMSARVTTIAATAILAYLDFGAWSMVIGTLVGSCTSVVVLASAMSRWPRPRFSRAEFRKLAAFGAFFSIERLLWGVLLRLFGLVLGYMHGVAVLGYFQFAQRLIDETANLIQTFVLRFGLSFFSALERAGRDPTEAFMKATLLITVVAAPVFTGLALVMPDLVGTIFAAKWAPAVIVSQVVALSWAISFPRALVASVLRARGRQGALALYSAVTCAVTILAGLLTGGQSLLIVALAWAPRYLIGIPWSIYAINRYLGISPTRQIANSIRPFIAAALMAGVVLGVSALLRDFAPIQRLVAEVVTGAVTYMAVLALIDRTTLRLGRSLLADMRQMMRTA